MSTRKPFVVPPFLVALRRFFELVGDRDLTDADRQVVLAIILGGWGRA